MYPLETMEKENKTLGTERCKNIDTLYTNKIITIINSNIQNEIIECVLGSSRFIVP